MGFDDLSNLLWQERRILEMLVFKLEEEQLVLLSGRHNWLAHATSEVEHVLEGLQAAGEKRSAAARDVATELGLGAQATLAQMADAAPDPWREILRQHRTAMLAAFEHIQSVSERNKEILARGLAATTDALALLGQAPVTGYGADGSIPPLTRSDVRLVNSTL